MSFDFNEFYRNFVRMLRTSPTSQPPNIVLLTCSIFFIYTEKKKGCATRSLLSSSLAGESTFHQIHKYY